MKISKQVVERTPDLWLQRGKGWQNSVVMLSIWQQMVWSTARTL